MVSDRILTALMAFFDQEEWSYERFPDKPILKLRFAGQNGNWTCYAQVRDLDEQFVFYSLCPLSVPERKRPALAEFLTRANYGLIIGNFEMDLSDGEVRYKSSFDAEGCELLPAMIKNTVYANVLTMDRYLPGVLAILGGNVEPQQAIDDIEAEERQASLRS